MTTARDLVDAERNRQQTALGYTAEHDDAHIDGEIGRMGACYADAASAQLEGSSLADEYGEEPHPFWPVSEEAWRPSDNPLRNLVKAAALLEAEIDKHLRRGAHVEPPTALHSVADA
jgi:hypothetical protein